jgi:hypothetical protein
MTKEKMNVHRALSELKVIDSRIFKAITDVTFVTSNKHSNDKIKGVSVSEFKDNMKSEYQKVNDLIARRNALKRAVVLSNANTTIEIDGNVYTVAEAIEMKNHGMEHFKTMLTYMTSQYNAAQDVLNKNSGEAIEKKAESYVLSVIQSQPKDSKMTVDDEAMKALRKTYIENNTYDIIDPIKIKSAMEELSEYITKFETEIDAALSCSNALTIIEFEY